MPLISPISTPPPPPYFALDVRLDPICRHNRGQVPWVEFVKLFEIADDQTGSGGIAALRPDLKEVKTLALHAYLADTKSATRKGVQSRVLDSACLTDLFRDSGF